MRWLKVSFWVVIIGLLAIEATAQTTNGTITGRVVDGQGLPMPGVTVSVASDSLLGGRNVVTSANGDYIVTLLPSGTYTVTFELSGFESLEKKVTLAPAQVVPLNITLGVAQVTEVVTVVGNRADVLTNTGQVATKFSQELLSTLPTNRSIDAALLLAPQVHATGPGGAYSFSGSMSFETLFMVNGVTVSENLRGQPLPLYIEDAVQETTITTAVIVTWVYARTRK